MWAGCCENREFLGRVFIGVSLNGNTYLQLINNEIIPQFIEMFGNQFDFDSGSFQQLWWMQDGSQAHWQCWSQ